MESFIKATWVFENHTDPGYQAVEKLVNSIFFVGLTYVVTSARSFKVIWLKWNGKKTGNSVL